MKVKEGDYVRVPAAEGRPWDEAQGQVEIIDQPYCRVKVWYIGIAHRIFYKIEEVEKI